MDKGNDGRFEEGWSKRGGGAPVSHYMQRLVSTKLNAASSSNHTEDITARGRTIKHIREVVHDKTIEIIKYCLLVFLLLDQSFCSGPLQLTQKLSWVGKIHFTWSRNFKMTSLHPEDSTSIISSAISHKARDLFRSFGVYWSRGQLYSHVTEWMLWFSVFLPALEELHSISISESMYPGPSHSW